VLPVWATRTIEAFSTLGDRVVVRSLGSHPSLPGEVAALIGAAQAGGRRPVALLPTPATAHATRALLPATAPTGVHTPVDTPAAAAATPAAADPGVATSPMATATGDSSRVAALGVAASSVATDRMGSPPEMATPVSTTVHGARPVFHRVPAPVGDRARVEVGRRRTGSEHGGAGLVVVVAGPVCAGARASRRPVPARVLASWTRVLRPGGVLVVLSPPEIGAQRRWRPPAPGLVGLVQDIGLSYLQHIVLVHAPVADGQLRPPASAGRPQAPFWSVHTDLAVFALPSDPFAQPEHAADGDFGWDRDGVASSAGRGVSA
jgi:hypothetical protein